MRSVPALLAVAFTTLCLPGPAAAQSSWKDAGSKTSFSIEATASDGRSTLLFSCPRGDRSPVVSFYIYDDPAFTTGDFSATASIDGRNHVMDVDGVDDGVVLSDRIRNNQTTVGTSFLTALASGRELTVSRKDDRGRTRVLKFSLRGSGQRISQLKKECRLSG